MKKKLSLLTLVLISISGFAQLDTISNNLFQYNGKLGIGTNQPSNALTIEGNETEWPGRIFLSINNKSYGPKSLAYISAKAGNTDNHTIFGHISNTYATNDSPEDLQDFGIISSSGNGLIIGATKNNSAPGIIKFVSGQSSGTTFDERMRIDITGNVGIGTNSPVSKLQVSDGDIYISDIEKGIIMKSPDGNCWRGVLDNSGQLNFSLIGCPAEQSNSINPQLKSSSNITVYPNPSNSIINIDINNTKTKRLVYKVYDLSGNLKDSGSIKSKTQTVDISNWSAGIYVLSVFDKIGNKIISQKIVKE